MAEVEYPIQLPRLAKLLMPLGGWLMLSAADEGGVRCHGFRKGLQRSIVQHAKAGDTGKKISHVTNARAVA